MTIAMTDHIKSQYHRRSRWKWWINIFNPQGIK